MSIFSKSQVKKVIVSADNHGYKPNTIEFKEGKTAQIKFIPKGNLGCLDQLNFKSLDIHDDLNGKKEVTVNIPTDKPGTYDFACGMDMFHGKVVVK